MLDAMPQTMLSIKSDAIAPAMIRWAICYSHMPTHLCCNKSGPRLRHHRFVQNKPEVILAACFVIVPMLVVFLAAQWLAHTGPLSGAEKG